MISFCHIFRPQIQTQPIDSDVVRRALDAWLQTTETDSKQLLRFVIDNISSVRTIHNINKAVSELGMCTIQLIFRDHINKYFLLHYRDSIELEANIAEFAFGQ